MSHEVAHKIILFDGVCNLCNSSVVFIIKRDKKDVFRFAALQSNVGMVLVNEHGIDTSKTDSIILIDGNRSFEKSSAALRIARELSGAYPLLYGFIIVPKFIRNWVYDYIAKNRYRWYGKKESCMIPTPELKSKFL
ncbi:thiol-disulfide oxidoreductase DCC family protein [Altibacter sp.]|uniref:thiol-disulfide oxidoreductase DCC family protein n=1 Tax=Altibacter sp. TaxID=2024823 RepID=UPI000C8E694B|nr:thiol-disulfide oxidoreductase DCC family protein [Altibacter sp.]MAP53838.1 thiol-disulfide oxidoreductase [Altibacter sp.]